MNKKFIIVSSIILSACMPSGSMQLSADLKNGIEMADAGVKNCIELRVQGKFKTYKETAVCGNNEINKNVLPHAKFKNLVQEFMSYRLAIAEHTDLGKYSYNEGQKLIMLKRESLTERALEMRTTLNEQQWAMEAQKDNPFKRVGCEFRVSGITTCFDW